MKSNRSVKRPLSHRSNGSRKSITQINKSQSFHKVPDQSRRNMHQSALSNKSRQSHSNNKSRGDRSFFFQCNSDSGSQA